MVGDDCPQRLDGIDGLVKARVLPPRGLYHPVLPARIHNRLMFPLCRTCAEDINQRECNHTEDQRALTGTWVSDELKKALSLGYTLERVYEVWSYKAIQFNKSEGLFEKYINKFLKLKQEASGWPPDCVAEAEKGQYILAFEEREGIRLTPTNIKQNKGFRALAKLMLKSFWGEVIAYLYNLRNTATDILFKKIIINSLSI